LTVREDAGFTKNEIVEYLEDNKIATRMLFAGNITCHPCFKDVKYSISGNLLNTDRIVNDTFWIGVYPGLTKEMITHMLNVFDEFIANLELNTIN
jgi:CDP-6-deoxy-D-xylo-4-hexulose-3-dehydrase